MLTRLRISRLKKFEQVDIELGQSVVFVGPNNSGKTTALQSLALWETGLRRWNEKRQGKESPQKRPGVTLNRQDLISIPIPAANLLWRDLHVRGANQAGGAAGTQNVRIDIVVDGIHHDRPWSCGLEFDYANEESLYCRPLRLEGGASSDRMPVPSEAGQVRVAFLPPMSGLAAVEPKWEPGRVNVLIGEGRTAQVLRNLCLQIHTAPEEPADWMRLVSHIEALFGVELLTPSYLSERGEITMSYREPNGTELDLSSSGRGLQQTLLLLAYLYTHPNTVLLLDEPDAHLEILRQRQIYRLLTDLAARQNSQVIAASHSEVVLNEAADRDMVIAFVGRPHRIDDRGSQVVKALRDIGFEHYYQAEQTGWVLYLEGSTDLAILRTFAEILDHPALDALEKPYVVYVGNEPNDVRRHFFGLREAHAGLLGIAIFDRLDRPLPNDLGAMGSTWRRREIENYLCRRDVLMAYARQDTPNDLFSLAERDRRLTAMRESIEEVEAAFRTLKQQDPWSENCKASDDVLDPVFRHYFTRLGMPNLLRKTDYHVLARLVPASDVDPDVGAMLDRIAAVHQRAKRTGGLP